MMSKKKVLHSLVCLFGEKDPTRSVSMDFVVEIRVMHEALFVFRDLGRGVFFSIWRAFYCVSRLLMVSVAAADGFW